MKKLIVERIDRYSQSVEVEVDENLSQMDQIAQAIRKVEGDHGRNVGGLVWHSISDSDCWTVSDGEEIIH